MSSLKLENLKPDDWITGKNMFNELLVRKVDACFKYVKNKGKERCITLNDNVLSKYNYNYLTLKPEVMQKNTVIHCPEKWMAEASCWFMDKLGKRWCNGESCLTNNRWSYYQEKTCYELFDGTYSKISFYTENNYKIIPFWDAVCGEDSVDAYNNNKEENVMCEEKKYEWCKYFVNSISICNVLIKAPECKDKEEFKAWCFDRGYTYDKVIFFSTNQGAGLLKELHKPNRKEWLNYAIKQGFVKEVKVEEIFRIGDVIEFIEKMPDVGSRFIINICKEDVICLNSKKGTRWGNMFSVKDTGSIKYDELYTAIKKNFKKVGHGVKDLL